jgi:hypothetical protein
VVRIVGFVVETGIGYIPNKIRNVGLQVLTAIVMNIATFWDIAPCSPYVNRRFGQMFLPSHLLHAGSLLGSFSKQNMEVIFSSKTSLHIRATGRYIPKDSSSQLSEALPYKLTYIINIFLSALH